MKDQMVMALLEQHIAQRDFTVFALTARDGCFCAAVVGASLSCRKKGDMQYVAR